MRSTIPERVEYSPALRPGAEHRVIADWRHVRALLQRSHHARQRNNLYTKINIQTLKLYFFYTYHLIKIYISSIHTSFEASILVDGQTFQVNRTPSLSSFWLIKSAQVAISAIRLIG